MNSLRWIVLTAASTCLIGLSLSNAAAQNTPVGLWKNVDDRTGKPKALIRITENNGEFQGTIEKLLREAGQDANPICDKCADARKNQPILGMNIITGMKRDGDQYSGGQILDPDNGKVYKSKLTLSEDGKKLNVRGYIGVPMLGRTQTWLREQ